MFIVIENKSYNLLFWTSPRIMTEKYSVPVVPIVFNVEMAHFPILYLEMSMH